MVMLMVLVIIVIVIDGTTSTGQIYARIEGYVSKEIVVLHQWEI